MKKVLVFLGLIALVGGTIYLTTCFNEEGDEVFVNVKPPTVESRFSERIAALEDLKWSNDSIQRLILRIEMSTTSGKIDASTKDKLLNTIENTESICLQNSFDDWVDNASDRHIENSVYERINTLSNKRSFDPELRKIKKALYSYGLQQALNDEVNLLFLDFFNKTTYSALEQKINRHLNNPLIQNCSSVRMKKNELLDALVDYKSFNCLYTYDYSEAYDAEDASILADLHYEESAFFQKYPKYEADYQRVMRDGFITLNERPDECD